MKSVLAKYPASFDGEGEGEGEGDDPKPKATDKEITDLIKAQAARINELEGENASFKELEGQVTKLQDTLKTQQSVGELVTELKAMADGSAGGGGKDEKHPLQIAAEAGDMKTFRKLRAAAEGE